MVVPRVEEAAGEGHTSYINAVAISPDGAKIVSGSADNTVRVWSMETGEVSELGCCMTSIVTH